MIKINLAPPRAKKSFSIQVPTFNLGILFGILFAALLVAIGGVWWYFDSETRACTTRSRKTRRRLIVSRS